ncbi:class II fructose-bisphosphatase [Microbacterium sp. A196]|uniref:class II fructose-bisphosphatase n=1 Tax=Microbacterium sp. A196 TaxID=3457320 RepID=UPI003FD161EB
MELVRATEVAAISAHAWIGRGDKNRADGAAVDAMRAFLSTLDVDGLIVIGEGEKDEAPMLYRGERVGTGRGPRLDIAVDPIDGTTLTAAGMPNALSVIAAADGGSMIDASEAFYMTKIVTNSDGNGVVHLDQTVAENIAALAAAKHKPVSAMQVAILNRPRHASLVEEVRATGARTRLISDGDVAAGINAAMDTSPVDMAIGVGGSPEGVATACAIKALDGYMQVRMLRNDTRRAARDLDYERIWEAGDLVQGDALFIATGVTDGDLLSGVRYADTVIRTESLILRSHTRTVRRIIAEHRADRWGQ